MQQIRFAYSEPELRMILETEQQLHPNARLVDIFKLLNQANFGPTHINPDPREIAANLHKELKLIEDSSNSLYQDIGCGRGFVRLNLAALNTINSRETDLIIEHLTQNILASRFTDDIDPVLWNDIWQAELPTVLEYIDPQPDEIKLVEEYLRTGNIPSHSELYRDLYHPHYRVIYHSECPYI